MAKPFLSCSTVHGVFTRRSDNKYTHVVVSVGMNLATLKEALRKAETVKGPMGYHGASRQAWADSLRRKIALVETGQDQHRAATWHSKASLAQTEACSRQRDARLVEIHPVDAPALSEFLECQEEFGSLHHVNNDPMAQHSIADLLAAAQFELDLAREQSDTGHTAGTLGAIRTFVRRWTPRANVA